MTAGSPAWKPQATFTDVTRARRSASWPMAQAPNPSPMSALRSIRGGPATGLVDVDGTDLPPDLPARKVRRVDVAVRVAAAHGAEDVLERQPAGDVGCSERVLHEDPVVRRVERRDRVGPGEVRSDERDAHGAVHSGCPEVDVRADDRGGKPAGKEAEVHAVPGHHEPAGAGGPGVPRGDLVGPGEVGLEYLLAFRSVVAARGRKSQDQDGRQPERTGMSMHRASESTKGSGGDPWRFDSTLPRAPGRGTGDGGNKAALRTVTRARRCFDVDPGPDL